VNSMSRLLTAQEIIRNQINHLESNTQQHKKPINTRKKTEGTLVERERKKREEAAKETKKRNMKYLTTSQVSPSMQQILAQKCPAKPTKKEPVTPIGQRTLGPGFLQRYGTQTPETSETSEHKEKPKNHKHKPQKHRQKPQKRK